MKKIIIFTSPKPYSGTSGLPEALCKKEDSIEPLTPVLNWTVRAQTRKKKQ